MMKNIKLWRKKNRKAELIRLSNEEKDFEYRNLFIKEYKELISINYNRHFISELIAWSLIFLASCYFQNIVIFLFVFILSLFFKVISYIFKMQYKKSIQKYNLGLTIINSVIYKEYGINYI